MSQHTIANLGPEVLRVVAAAIAHERRFGQLPSATHTLQIAEAEGASAGASLVAVRWEIRTRGGYIASLSAGIHEAPGLIEDDLTRVAIDVFARDRGPVTIRLIDATR